MAIKIYNNKIEFINDEAVTFTLTETADGFDFSGTITADNFAPPVSGTVAGFSSAGRSTTGAAHTNTVYRFPFANDSSVSSYATLTRAAYFHIGHSSSVSGYNSGGDAPPFPTVVNTIDKFPFSAGGASSDVGDLTNSNLFRNAGFSSSTHGFLAGGTLVPFANTIQRFPFATDTNATNVGTLLAGRSSGTSQSSTTHGFVSGGYLSESFSEARSIERISFSTGSGISTVGNLTVTSRRYSAGHSSPSHGYTSGGSVFAFSPTVINITDKFPFATNANATDVGDLTLARYLMAAVNSTLSGYTIGGFNDNTPPGTSSNIIDKFPFSSDTNSSDVGDLPQTRLDNVGQQD